MMLKMAGKKTSWCQNRDQALFRKSCFFPLQKRKPNVTCTRNCRKFYGSSHSHKKWKGSLLEGSLDRVLIATELEFRKILVLRLPQHTSIVNIEYAGKPEWLKQLYYLYGTSFLEH